MAIVLFKAPLSRKRCLNPMNFFYKADKKNLCETLSCFLEKNSLGLNILALPKKRCLHHSDLLKPSWTTRFGVWHETILLFPCFLSVYSVISVVKKIINLYSTNLLLLHSRHFFSEQVVDNSRGSLAFAELHHLTDEKCKRFHFASFKIRNGLGIGCQHLIHHFLDTTHIV